MVYSLCHLEGMDPVVQSEACHLSDQVFHLHKDNAEGPKSKTIINRALAGYFSKGNKHCFNELK